MFVLLSAICIFSPLILLSQSHKDLHEGWKCKNIESAPADGKVISQLSYSVDDWMPATVPGTVLTTLLDNGLVPDPNYGMNNENIPDIYDSGNVYYTYWFVNDFEMDPPGKNEKVWVHFRGVNYSCDVFMNGQKLNQSLHQGMFLRQTYNITALLSENGKNP